MRFSDVLIGIIVVLCMQLTNCELNSASVSKGISVLAIVPANDNQIYILNRKFTFTSGYYHGWILPSNEKIQLNFTLFSPVELTNDQIRKIQGLYVYFTTNDRNCNDHHQEHHMPLSQLYSLDVDVYTAQVQVRLEHADTPYYICLQRITDSASKNKTRVFEHQGTEYWLSIITTKDDIPIWLRICIFTCLLVLSGLFSGLNLGLMSLDLSELEILKKIGTEKERFYAKKIYPLRKRGNFLLCTILLGNVLVNSISTLILGDLLSGVYAAFGSTILIVLFGEIIPQAACSKHGLAVGAYTRYITYMFMFLTSPVSYPLGKLLDLVLGKEIAATYNREKIRELMKSVKDLEAKEFKMISGALDFTKRIVKDIMTPIKDVYMLDVSANLDFVTIAEISQIGFSRIPVYETSRDNIVGLLHVKDFTLLDPDDNMPVKALLEFYNHKVTHCYMDDKLDQMFEKFRQGETHLAFVVDTVQDEDRDPYFKCVGIITLEDIIEELVQFEIYDEFDDRKEIEEDMKLCESEKLLIENEIKIVNSDESERNSRNSPSTSVSSKKSSESQIKETKANNDKLTCARRRSQSTEITVNNREPKAYNQTHELAFFIQQQKDANHSVNISPQLRLASFQFLSSSVKPFTKDFITKSVLELIFKKEVFKESINIDRNTGPADYLYQYGKPCNYFVLILSGEATIEVGREKLEFIAGQFSYFGVNALITDPTKTTKEILDDTTAYKQYVPDFSLRVDTKCVYIKLDRNLWLNGVRKSQYEMLSMTNENTENHQAEQISLTAHSNVHTNANSKANSIMDVSISMPTTKKSMSNHYQSKYGDFHVNDSADCTHSDCSEFIELNNLTEK